MTTRPQLALSGLKKVFSRPSGVATAAVFAFIAFFIAIWITNISLLKEVLFGDSFSFSARIEILLSSFGGIKSNFAATSRVITLLITSLFGVNASMVAHYLKRRFVLDRAAGSSILGTVFGMLGVGCASCGSVIVSTLLGASFVGMLPFKGLEFGMIGIVILLISVYLIAIKIAKPETCSF